MSTKIDVHEPPVASKYKPCVWDSSLDSQDVACLEWFREYLCENTVTALHNYAGSVLMLQQRAKRMGLDCEVFTVRDPLSPHHSTWRCLTACVPVPGFCRQPVRAHDMARQRPIEAWPPPQQSHGACHSCTKHVCVCVVTWAWPWQQDVVPAEEAEWCVDPFAAVVKDGRVYGRGTQDMKCVGAQYLEAVVR